MSESNLATYARTELERAGMFDDDADYGPQLGEHILEIVRVFSTGGHSGGSAAIAIEILQRLLRYEPLTPLTYEPDEWNNVGDGMWQNRRKSDVFSRDGGATWYCLDGTSGTRQQENESESDFGPGHPEWCPVGKPEADEPHMHCVCWGECEPCCRCGDDTPDLGCDCPRCSALRGVPPEEVTE